MQLPLHPDSSTVGRVQRTIHYLGSKLRAIDPIRQAVSAAAPVGKPVCDLFAGSGIVTLALSTDWDVTSVDIQEYSRVLCNGLVNSPPNANDEARHLCRKASESPFRSTLRSALSGLLAYEKECLTEASEGTLEGICDLLEHGSLLPPNASREMPLPLRRELNAALIKLDELGLARGPHTVVTRHFGGRYFSWEQAVDLDATLAEIHLVNQSFRDFYLAAALVVASNLVNTIGKQFAQPIKLRDGSGHPKKHLVKQTLRDRAFNVFDSYRACCKSLATLHSPRRPNRSVKSDYVEFLERDNTEFAAFYADPPYTRDHYSRFYHVLETMALRDEPEVATTKIHSNGVPRLSRGVYRLERHQSPFCIPTRAPRAFELLFSAVAKRRVPLILSYSPYRVNTGNRPRLLTMDQLFEIAKLHFREVEIVSLAGISHNKLNLVERNIDVDYPAEVLIYCHS